MKEKIKTFSISQVSKMTGVSKNRIREWHDKGYLPQVQWISVGSRNHRRFTSKAIETIRSIDRYQKEGFLLTMAAIRGNEPTIISKTNEKGGTIS